MRAFRFARIYLSALEATGLVVITASDSPAGLAPNYSPQGDTEVHRGSLLSFF